MTNKSYTKEELDSLTVAELKQICRNNGISGYSNKNRSNLISYMLTQFRKQKNSKNSKKKGCHFPDGCATKTKAKGGYSAVEIRALAKECNLNIKGKTRKQLCLEIAEALRKSSSSDGGDKREECKAKNGNPYTKTGCSRYGKKKGCSWDDINKKCYKHSLGTDEEPSPTPSETDSDSESEKCYGGNRRELIKKKSKELRELLTAAGIKEGRPQAKNDLINYLCALSADGKGSRCDPENNKFCDGENVCDVKSKLCLPPATASARTKLEARSWNGRKIIGTKKALEKLWKKLGKAPYPPTDDQEGVDEDVEEASSSKKPQEGERVISIEEILEQLEKDDKVDVEEMSEVQREVLTCLGLLSSA